MDKFPGFSFETPLNYEQKCLCVLVLDVSYSMQGQAMEELNQGLQAFYSEIKSDSTTANRLEVAIVTFSDIVETIQPPSLTHEFHMPFLEVRGSTRLVDGVYEGIQLVEQRKSWYKETGQPYYRPWIILITDGQPDRGQDIRRLSQDIHLATNSLDSVSGKKFIFFAIGVEGANMETLKEISSPAMPPAKLQGLQFSSFFKWLSASMSTVTHSAEGEEVNLPSPVDWMQGFKIN